MNILKFAPFFVFCFFECDAMSSVVSCFMPGQKQMYVGKFKNVCFQINSILSKEHYCYYDSLFKLRSEIVRETDDMDVGEALADYIDHVKLLLIRNCTDLRETINEDLERLEISSNV